MAASLVPRRWWKPANSGSGGGVWVGGEERLQVCSGEPHMIGITAFAQDVPHTHASPQMGAATSADARHRGPVFQPGRGAESGSGRVMESGVI